MSERVEHGGRRKVIEFENKQPQSYHAIPETGYWRLTRADRRNGQCHAGIEKKLNKKRGSSSYDPFLKDFCITAEKIDKPKNGHAIGGSDKEWIVNGYYKSTITHLSTRIWDINTDKILGKRVNYLLNPWPESALDYGVVYDCADIGIVEREEPLIRQVLKPYNK